MNSVMVSFFLFFSLFAQSQGLIFDYDAFEERKVIERTRSDVIPLKSSIEVYTPYILHQRGGTCVAYSVAVARTILYARNNKLNTKKEISSNLFSPHWVYFRNRDEDDLSCEKGLNIETVIVDVLNNGIVQSKEVEYPNYYPFGDDWLCNYYPESYERDVINAKLHRVDDAFRLDGLEAIKLAISNRMPVIVGMLVPESFQKCQYKDIWTEKLGDNYESSYGHALIVVAYDDDKYGGAVKILNSWGESWGNKGLIWIPYDDFQKYTIGAYALENKLELFGHSKDEIGSPSMNFKDREISTDTINANTNYAEIFNSN